MTDPPQRAHSRLLFEDNRPLGTVDCFEFILAHPQPYQVVTTDQGQLAALRKMISQHPDVDVQIVEYNPSVKYQTTW